MQLSGCLGLNMVLECTSGDIEFTNCDGNDIAITTISGDIEGSFASGKIFESHTVSGDVKLPHDDPSGGRCKVKTTSGDAEIDIA